MSQYKTTGAFVAVLIVTTMFFAPAAFFATPTTAHAQVGPEVPVGEVPYSFLTVKNAFTAFVQSLEELNKTVLAPIALVRTIGLTKALTAATLAFVTGAANGSGAPQFTQNLQENLRKVGDTQALSFFAQFGRRTNSPFGSSITLRLRENYLQQTSLAGFWNAYRSTLGLSSPNINAFLAGNWSQGGGAKAWFALTTHPQNNPYLLYQAAEGTLANVVGVGESARKATLDWGQGMLSWCGPTDTSGYARDDDQNAANGRPEGGACDFTNEGTQDGTWQNGTCVSNGTHGSSGTKPGDPCLTKDGNPGTIKTPGSVITASLNKVLGAGQDRLNQLGNYAQNIASVANGIATMLQTVALVDNIIKGPAQKGLAGASVSGSADVMIRDQLSSIGQTSTLTARVGERVTAYETAWNTIFASVISAESEINSMVAACPSQASAGNTAMQAVSEVRRNATNAFQTITIARNDIRRISSIASSTTVSDTEMLNLLTQLSSARPTDDDVLYAQTQSRQTGAAFASPQGSLVVSGGTLVDQMSLIKSNAENLKACGAT